MIENTRAKQILERDYSIWSHQSWITWRYPIPRNWLIFEALLNWDATDTSWYWNNWSPINMVWADTDVGYQKQCGSFNGSNARVWFTNSVVTWTVLTVSLWIKNWASSQSADTTIISNQSDGPCQWFVIGQRPNAWNSWNLFYWDGLWGNITNWQWINTNLFSLDVWVWTHILWIINWNNIKIYKNWVLLSNSTYSQPISINSTKQLSIWAFYNWGNPNRWFNWNIQLARIYNIVLSDKENQMLYKEWLKLLH